MIHCLFLNYLKSDFMKVFVVCLLALLGISTLSFAQDIPDGLKAYTFVMLIKGDTRDHNSEETEAIQKAHMQYMDEMAEKHGLNVAGPFLDDGFWRGILIFDETNVDIVKELVENDPAVKAGRLKFEIHPWMTQKGVVFK